MGIALLATVAAFAGVLIGVFFEGAGRGTRIMVPFAGGLLMGIPVFGLFPELITQIGWAAGLLWSAAGYVMLLIINRYLFPVCPSCANDHGHESCPAALHGFTAPLVSAAVIHSALDGWSIVTAQWAAPMGVRLALPLAVALHKIPEGIALGAILRASTTSPGSAVGCCLLAEGATLAGGAAALGLAPYLKEMWLSYPLAIAGGVFLYLGFHAVHGEWKRRGAIPAFMPALTGVAGAALLQRGVQALLR